MAWSGYAIIASTARNRETASAINYPPNVAAARADVAATNNTAAAADGSRSEADLKRRKELLPLLLQSELI